jgi:hypothetical protein
VNVLTPVLLREVIEHALPGALLGALPFLSRNPSQVAVLLRWKRDLNSLKFRSDIEAAGLQRKGTTDSR